MGMSGFDRRRKEEVFIRFSAVILWMVLIFFFSHQEAVDSSAASGKAAEILGYMLRTFFAGLGEVKIQAIMEDSVFWIRKCAHMGVYFVLCLLLLYALYSFELSKRMHYGLALFVSIFYSISDEIHQYFIPGRSCEFRDVCIDTGGALLALLLVFLVCRICKKRRNTQKACTRVPQYSILVMVVLAFAAGVAFSVFSTQDKSYTAEDFGLTDIVSPHDEDGDGIDDYTDLIEGARKYLGTHPSYKSKYYEGGYPTDGFGVCTDVIWHAFEEAGYSLKDLVDADILASPESYPNISEPDPNIDFRRVRNLNHYFDRHLNVLPISLENPADWQPGDIVTFVNPGHIAICSNLRNKEGFPFILHLFHGGGREDNDIEKYTIVGHYRIPEDGIKE